MKQLVVAGMIGALSLGIAGCDDDDNNNNGSTPPRESGGDGFQLQLLHFADIDGGRDIIGNAPRFSALASQFSSEYENTLLLSSGDNWIPGPEYNVASADQLADVLGVPAVGRAHVAFLNALGVQASAFGNHEFDAGTGAIAGILSPETDGETGAEWAGAQFPYLSSNLDFTTDESLAPLLESGLIAPSTTLTVNGETIGVVGATTPTLASITSPGDVTILPQDATDMAALAAQIQAAVDALTETGINKVILLSHMQQIAIEKALAPLLSDVDIIVSGGSNTILADETDRLRVGDSASDEYPLAFTSASDEPVLVVNTDGDFTYLGRLVVSFDDAGVIQTDTLDAEINGAYATDEQGLVEQGLSDSEAMTDVTAISNALTSALLERAGNVVGQTEVYLNGERGSVRTQETNLGNLTAEANLAYAQSVDSSVSVSLKNGGGIRASIGSCIVPPGSTAGDSLECLPPQGTPGISLAGQISQFDLEIALRFNNGLTLLTLTGEQLIQILEHGVAATAEGVTPGQFPQVAGLTFSFDPSETAQTVDDSGELPVVATPGSRIKELVVLDDNGAEPDGESVTLVTDGVIAADAATREFRIVTLGFLAGGGDSYPFPSAAASNMVDLEQEGVQSGDATFADDGTEQDALAEYLLANFPPDEDDATPAYAVADTTIDLDIVIVNLLESVLGTQLAMEE